MPSTAVEKTSGSKSLIAASNFTAAEVDVIRDLIAPGADDAELAVFLRIAQKYDLDPFTKQIYAIKNEKRPQDAAVIMVSRDGFLAIAERSGHYRGMHSGVVKERDTFEAGRVEARHVHGETRGKIVGAFAYVYRDDRDVPATFYAPWAEYGLPMTREGGNPQGKRINLWSPWSKTPSAMILKVAEANALRRAFTVSGVEAAEDPAAQPEYDVAVTTELEPSALTPLDHETPFPDADTPIDVGADQEALNLEGDDA